MDCLNMIPAISILPLSWSNSPCRVLEGPAQSTFIFYCERFGSISHSLWPFFFPSTQSWDAGLCTWFSPGCLLQSVCLTQVRGWSHQLADQSLSEILVPSSLFFINPPFPLASFSLSLLIPSFSLSSFSEHHQSPQNLLLASTPASATGHVGPHSCLTADSSSDWIQQKLSLWKTMHTLFLFFQSRNGCFYVMLNVPLE